MNMHAPDIFSSLRGRSLAIYLPDLAGGGTERMHINLAPHFLAAGMRVTFLLDRRSGALLDKVPEGAEVHVLGASRQVAAIPKLIHYLRSRKVDFLISNMEHGNIISIWARRLANVSTRIIVAQHCSFRDQVSRGDWKFKILPRLYRATLPKADAIVCVSNGVAAEIADVCGLGLSRMNVIYNGATTAELKQAAEQPVDHPWFALGEPVLVAAGRLVELKDYPTLLRAFAGIVKQRPARLIVLGDGPLRSDLKALAKELAIEDRMDLPGFVPNPMPYMRNAAAFVLTSRAEGFGNVLVEAMACGTPVVSTDCPHGPAEILDYGRYGRLTPPGDPAALATAILATLAAPLPAAMLEERAAMFSTRQCALDYLALFSDLFAAREASAHAPG
jgi:glycosyltransferase involved in cell wall biosynthesis